MIKVKKVVLSLVLSVLILIPAMLLLTACGNISINMRLTIGENIKGYINEVRMASVTASQPDFESPVYVSEDEKYNGKTADVLIEFIDGYEPENAVITVNGENFTDFTVKTYSDNEFSRYIDFSLPCKSDTSFELTLDVDGFKEIKKTYAININVPQDVEGQPVTKDFVGREYLKEISILSFKGEEQEPQYHTLEEIAQLDKDASQKVQFKAYMKIDRPWSEYVPIFYIHSATQYVNAYNDSSFDPDKASIISNIFKIGDYNLYFNKYFYDYTHYAIEEIGKGNILLSVEQDKLISGLDTMYIDTTVLLNAFNKVYTVEVSEEGEFGNIFWQGITSGYTYGEEQTFTITPNVRGNEFPKENIDLSEAEVYINGIEISGERLTINTEGTVHTLTFKLKKGDTSNYINGQKTNDETGKMIVEVRNIKFRNTAN